MNKVLIKHNPYTVSSVIEINGKPIQQDSRLTKYLRERFQMWVDDLPDLLAEECNVDRFDITFQGTDPDYLDLLASAEDAKSRNIFCRVTRSNVGSAEFGAKEDEIRALIARAQKLPFDEINSPAVKDAIENAFNADFEVNVVATMSAGKSTLINAMLQQKLMPSKQGACTATVTRIRDKDKEDTSFSAIAFDPENQVCAEYPVLDYGIMQELNDDPHVSEIHATGNIPFVDSQAISLILIDTPGTDNAIEKRHGEVTYKALAESSKMLVLFIMNGTSLHNEAQDRLLRTIAESMKVGGKQSKERFLFVISKMDEYDEEDDDIAGQTIPETVEYLQQMGIENPNIFPVAAEPALMIRRYLRTQDPLGRAGLEKKLKYPVEKMNDQKQLHLEQYPHLSKSCQQKIDEELNTAIAHGDLLGQALIHTGIRGIEETIRMYVTKYCRPAKIKNVYDTFSNAMESAQMYERTRAQIASEQEHQKEYGSQIEALKVKLASGKENEKFKERIRKLDISSSVERDVQRLYSPVEKELTNLFKNCSPEMDDEEAAAFYRRVAQCVEHANETLQANVTALLEKNIQATGRKLVSEYVHKLQALSDEYSEGGRSIDLDKFVGGTLHVMSQEKALEAARETRTTSHTETRYVTKTRRRKWYNPIRIFKGNRYQVKVPCDYEVLDVRTFFSAKKLQYNTVGALREEYTSEINRVVQFSEAQTKRIKEYFVEQFDEVDQILAQKLDELTEAIASRQSAEEAKKRAEGLLKELNAVKTDLENILSI